MSVVVEKYSEKSIIVKGNTKLYKSNLMELGGKWNPTLQGWIFASSKKETVDKVNKLVDDINNGQVKAVVEEADKFFITKEAYLDIISRLEHLELQVKHKNSTSVKSNKKNISDSESESESESENEPVVVKFKKSKK